MKKQNETNLNAVLQFSLLNSYYILQLLRAILELQVYNVYLLKC